VFGKAGAAVRERAQLSTVGDFERTGEESTYVQRLVRLLAVVQCSCHIVYAVRVLVSRQDISLLHKERVIENFRIGESCRV
jgi:hypothetical protein